MKDSLAALAALTALLAAPACDFEPPFAREKPQPAPPAEPKAPLPQPTLTTREGSTTIADVAQSALPSVVSIASTRQLPRRPVLPFLDDPFLRRFFEPFGGPGDREDRSERGLGSGVIVSADGVVLTNNHVIARAEQIIVTTPGGDKYDAEVVGTDPKSDLAVIRLQGDVAGLQPIAIGDASRLRLGDVVLAIGNPFGVGQTVTMGIVSAKGRANLGIVDYEDFIQTDAAINPGNSGGALIDMEGKLVGIATAILSRHGGYMGIGFAIPTNMATPIMHSLLEHGEVSRGWLGVVIQDIDRELAAALKLPSADGVLVAEVQPGAPAERAGIRRGDVILSIDDTPIDGPSKLRNKVAAAGAAAVVKVEILRDGRQRTLSVELGELPGEPSAPVPTAPKAEPRPQQSLDGLTLEPLDPATRARHRIPSDVTHGVVVESVERGSAAAKAGLMPGDVLLEVDRQKVGSVAGLTRLWKQARGKTALLIWRQGNTAYLVIER